MKQLDYEHEQNLYAEALTRLQAGIGDLETVALLLDTSKIVWAKVTCRNKVQDGLRRLREAEQELVRATQSAAQMAKSQRD